MKRTVQDDIEILSDGFTVWVNTPESNIGRFGRYGIDVHRTIQAQMEGQSECLACTHGPTNISDWRRFQSLMKQHYNVTILDYHMPGGNTVRAIKRKPKSKTKPVIVDLWAAWMHWQLSHWDLRIGSHIPDHFRRRTNGKP